MSGRTSQPASRRAARRSACPVASALDLIGDRWTLVIVRDLTIGKARFAEFLASPEGVPTNILADRLKQLEAAGLVRRIAYSKRPPRHEYRLTDAGASLLPVVQAMARWANANIDGTWAPPQRWLDMRPEDAPRGEAAQPGPDDTGS